MAYITEFSISGLTGRKEVYSQQLNKDINVFFGLNGSGKTSLLKILHSAMANETDTLRNVPFEAAIVKIYSAKYEQEFKYSIKQTKHSNSEEITDEEIQTDTPTEFLKEYLRSKRPAWTIEPKLPSKASGKWMGHRYLPTSRLYRGTYTIPGVINSKELTEEQLDLVFARELQRLWTRYSAPLLAAVRKAQGDALVEIFKAVLSSQEPKETAQPIDIEIAYNRMVAFLKRQQTSLALGSLAEFQKRYQTVEKDPISSSAKRDV